MSNIKKIGNNDYISSKKDYETVIIPNDSSWGEKLKNYQKSKEIVYHNNVDFPKIITKEQTFIKNVCSYLVFLTSTFPKEFLITSKITFLASKFLLLAINLSALDILPLLKNSISPCSLLAEGFCNLNN